MNSDDYADVIVGMPNMSDSLEGFTSDGYVNLYLTSPTTELPVYSVTIVGLCSHAMLGTSLSYGYPFVSGHEDLVAGAPGGVGSSCPSVEVMKYSP